MLHHHRKSSAHTFRSKEFRQLHQEYQKICREKFRASEAKLETPFQRGYERFFILTEQAKRRDDVDQLAFVLKFFESYQYCRKGQFRTGKPEGRRWAKGEVGKHQIQRPYFNDLVKKSYPRTLYPYLKSYHLDFLEPVPPYRRMKHHQKNQKVTFRYQRLIQSHTQPHVVTHLPLHDPEREARLEELERILWRGSRPGEVRKALHLKRWHYFDRPLEEKIILADFRHQLHEANSDPSLKSAVSPRFFYVRLLLADLTTIEILTPWRAIDS